MVRVPPLRLPPIGFAHRGARAQAPENTIEAFTLALRLGATGLETDAWVTADGQVVLDHDGVWGGRLRRRPIAETTRAELPTHVPTIEELYEACGAGFELSVDVKDPAAAPGLVAAARAAGAPERLWLCHHEWQLVATWRRPYEDVRLVDSTRLARMTAGAERRAAQLSAAAIDAVNLHRSDWSGGLTALFHRFSVLAFGWDCQFERHLEEVLDHGCDAVYSDHVDRMVEAIERAHPSAA